MLAVAGLLPAFMLTTVLVRSHKAYRARLATTWIGRGEEALKRRDTAGAIADFQAALQLRPDVTSYRLRLAGILANTGSTASAERELLAAREDHPADGRVNLALARLTATRGETAAAIAYCQAAVGGNWPADVDQRQAAESELALLRVGRRPATHP